MTYGNLARPYPEAVEALEHVIRQRDAEIKRLRTELAHETAVRANHDMAIDALRQERAEQAERIAALEAEVESLTAHVEHLWSGLERALERARDRLNLVGYRSPTGQHDLPPTRAESVAGVENEEREE